ncbi:MAG TPA: hypothetical protein VHY37_01505 [Tepidisphaeraceae bacterium]|jgi:hypothetical protein|nr:hypothetical protein [Tepidisphaeraceae bacterium]
MSFLLAVAALLATVVSVRADDAAQATTLKGTMVCAKCFLHLTDTCQNVLQVKDGDKTVNYWLVDNDVSKDFHKNVCHAPKKDVAVTGAVEEKDGKEWITATKIEAADSDK